jgi:hypothetical protein
MQWPTATSTDQKSSGSAAYSTESGRHSGTTLTDAAKQWPTPRTKDAEGWEMNQARKGLKPEDTLTGQARQWATPSDHDARRPSDDNSTQGRNLQREADNWGTPRSSDYKGSDDHGFMLGKGYLCAQAETNFSHQDQATHAGPPSCETTRNSRRRLNPAFTCWLMGAPWWWTRAEQISCAAAEMAWWSLRQRALLSSYCDGLECDRSSDRGGV